MQTKECPYPDDCPRLGNQRPEVVLAKVRYLETRVDELEAGCQLGEMALKMRDEKISSLEEEIHILKTENTQEREKIYKPAKKEKRAGKPGAPVGHRGILNLQSNPVKGLRIFLLSEANLLRLKPLRIC